VIQRSLAAVGSKLARDVTPCNLAGARCSESRVSNAPSGLGRVLRTIWPVGDDASGIGLTAGQAGDNPQLLPLLDAVSVARVEPERPRRRPDRVVAERAYSHPSTRAALRFRGIAFTSPERTHQIAHRRAKGSTGGRPPAVIAS
jgi:hypothetical protein